MDGRGRTKQPVETATRAQSDVVVLDRYRLARRLGSGGMGVVWLAHDLKLDRPVALKKIVVGDDAVAERARREGLAAARLSHPAIVLLHEAVADEDAVYLVSELVRGGTLAELCAEGALSDREVLQVGVALCEALGHAHSRGVVHRDVKPGNVIVPDEWLETGAGPAAKLTDFGIARIAGDDALTRTGDVVGTLAYMAPEQAEGRGASEPADTYALALCIYEALSGVNPVRGRGAGSTARRVGMRLPPLGRLRRDLPLDLCEAVDAAVWPHPDDRASLKELKAALKRAVPGAGDERGTVDGSPLEPVVPVAPPTRIGLPARLVAALAAGTLTAILLASLGPVPPDPVVAGPVAALTVFLLPRLGWMACAVGVAAWLADAGATETAWLIAAGAAPVPLLLRRSATWWTLPAAGPLFALGGLAGVLPALAGQAPRWDERFALGLLGGWWVALAEVARLERVEWESLAVAGIWGLAATGLPWLVRGRSAAIDLVGASAWAAGTAAAVQATTQALGQPAGDGLVLAAVLAGALALAFAASRRGA